MAEYDFGDIAGSLSLTGGETAGPAFAGGYNLGPATATGFDFNVPDVQTPQVDPGVLGSISEGAKTAGGAVKTALTPFADVAKAALPIAGLGTGIMGIMGGVSSARNAAEQNKIAKQGLALQQEAAGATRAAAQPLTTFGQEQLEQATKGQIPAAIQAKIDLWKQGAIAQAKDYAARSGQGESMMLQEWIAWIEQQAQGMAATYLQEEQRLGIQGLTQGAQTIAKAGGQAGAVSQQAQEQGSALQGLIEQSNKVLAQLTASAA